jgi:REP element-mobilizing transposase RayT
MFDIRNGVVEPRKNRTFWVPGYYVSTIGLNEELIK